MKIKISELWFPPPAFKQVPWYLRILGFYIEYEVKVLDEPLYHNGTDIEGWSYAVKPLSYAYHWLWIKLKTVTI